MSARSGWSQQERDLRSRPAKRVSSQGLVRGNMVLTRRTCGKESCRCRRGERHLHWYLGFADQATTKMMCVPRDWEDKVRGWVDNYHQVLDLLEQLSRLYVQRLKERKD